MNKNAYFAIDYYDRRVIESIIEKYGIEEMEAARRFLTSQTHELLEDPQYGVLSMPARAVFDMWEAEQVTGDPRNSIHVRAE